MGDPGDHPTPTPTASQGPAQGLQAAIARAAARGARTPAPPPLAPDAPAVTYAQAHRNLVAGLAPQSVTEFRRLADGRWLNRTTGEVGDDLAAVQ